jgi:hypothetical protein
MAGVKDANPADATLASTWGRARGAGWAEDAATKPIPTKKAIDAANMGAKGPRFFLPPS